MLILNQLAIEPLIFLIAILDLRHKFQMTAYCHREGLQAVKFKVENWLMMYCPTIKSINILGCLVKIHPPLPPWRKLKIPSLPFPHDLLFL